MLLFFCLILEAFLMVWLLRHSADLPALSVLLFLHILLSFGCALLVRATLPKHCREPRNLVLVLLFSLAFFLPQAGALGLGIAMILVELWPDAVDKKTFRALPPLEFTTRGPHAGVHFGVGGVRARLADQQVAAESRLEALLAVKAMPQHLSSPILRSLLDDPEEDLRLLAYGMLDTEEKNINQQINIALAEYRLSTQNKPDISRKLAFLYWELIYQNLVQGDVRLFVIKEAARYAVETLDNKPEDASVWVLLGKIHNVRNDWPSAEAALLQAKDLGFPPTRLTPYLAEHAFQQREFDQVRVLMGPMESLAIGDRMRPTARFWSKQV
ncbi:MAG: hypothetical protein P4L87_07035 [Formivibrio sp.]|nr:hypothetical protein [Formivibrio sp.]